jgi:hypothetical protein
LGLDEVDANDTPSREEVALLLEQFSKDLDDNLALMQSICDTACPCCPNTAEYGDTREAGVERIKNCKEDAKSIIENLKKGWKRHCGGGSVSNYPGVGGYLCFHWSEGFAKWAKAGNKNGTWQITEQWSAFKPKAGQAGTVHAWLELIPCPFESFVCEGRDQHRVNIDDGYYYLEKGKVGKFVDFTTNSRMFGDDPNWIPQPPDKMPRGNAPGAGGANRRIPLQNE